MLTRRLPAQVAAFLKDVLEAKGVVAAARPDFQWGSMLEDLGLTQAPRPFGGINTPPCSQVLHWLAYRT